MAAIKHLFHVDAPTQKVYDALTSLKGLRSWWTEDTTGDTTPGGTIAFRFGGGGMDFKVINLEKDQKVEWKCVAGFDDWLPTSISFQLDENEGKTRVRFSHDGWENANDHYANCNFSWGRYMESLRQYCQVGEGAPFKQPSIISNN
jgi:uncharacterized protein YndB with AHSA1/START domain